MKFPTPSLRHGLAVAAFLTLYILGSTVLYACTLSRNTAPLPLNAA